MSLIFKVKLPGKTKNTIFSCNFFFLIFITPTADNENKCMKNCFSQNHYLKWQPQRVLIISFECIFNLTLYMFIEVMWYLLHNKWLESQ